MSTYSGQLRAQLEKLRQLAIQRGGQNQPSSTAFGPDEHESALIAEAQSYAVQIESAWQKTRLSAEAEIAQCNTRAEEVRIQCAAALSEPDASAVVQRSLSTERPALVDLRVQELQLSADFNRFRAEQNISEMPSYPADKVHHMAWIFLCMAIETVLNSVFFANDRGFVGGAVVALAVSAANMASAGLLGYFFRYRHHRAAIPKFWGWMSLLGFLLSTVYLNALFATFRLRYLELQGDTSTRAAIEAFAAAVQDAASLFALHMPFRDLLSFLLFIVGVILSLFAFYKGYTFEDRYPGHGERHRRWSAVVASTTGAETAARQRLQEQLEQHRRPLNAAKQALLAEPEKVPRIAERLEGGASQRAAEFLELRNDLALVLDTYRQTNRGVRSTPAPAYFDSPPQVPTMAPDDGLEPTKSKVSTLTSKWAALREQFLERLSTAIQAAVRAEAHEVGPGFAAYQQSIRADAERAIAARQADTALAAGVR